MRLLVGTLFFLITASCISGRPEEKDYDYEEEIEGKNESITEESGGGPSVLIPEIDPEKVKEILNSKEQTKRMVDCVIFFEEGCPKELETVNRMAPEIFRRGGRCYGCSKEDQTKLRDLLVELQRRQPSEYRRLIRELNRI